MGIRKHNKDHLRAHANTLSLVLKNSPRDINDRSITQDPLLLLTIHNSHPREIDLRVFRDGESEPPLKGGVQWCGPFTGRPTLIAQLAPAIQGFYECASPATIQRLKAGLRAWWRLFDAVEKNIGATEKHLVLVHTVADLTEVHRQYALDSDIGRQSFGALVRLVDSVRNAQKIRPLRWTSPAPPDIRRKLPAHADVKDIRSALKHSWRAALLRWERCDQLLNVEGVNPIDKHERRLLSNYQLFKKTMQKTGVPNPRGASLEFGLRKNSFARSGYNIGDMLRGFYPDASDIRAAFHLCLASTGWNASVLTSLDASDGDSSFIEAHPKDPARYIMRGFKERGKSEQLTEGLQKSRESAGMIIKTIFAITMPLRDQLKKDLANAKLELDNLLAKDHIENSRKKLIKKIGKLKDGCRSPWLYATAASGIGWLDDSSYSRSGDDNSMPFLACLITQLNERRPENKKLPIMRPSDFRDAFAAYAYNISGGMVLYVMKVLGHKHPKTTQAYLDNSLLNQESNNLYRAFSEALWNEIAVHKRLDPTIIAKWSQDGQVTDSDRDRLKKYRSMKVSRIGVGCKDPTNPPKYIAPGFIPNGRAACHVQRCTLCLEHAIIFPESLPGLAKREAELLFIQSTMSVEAFTESTFGEELKNTEIALNHFDKLALASHRENWERRIKSGDHRVIEFDGLQGN
ncbi:MAG: hypothetical protein WA071_00785 [Undibacterium umbellatum]|uniref:hypothetical protein n=1 Tax=Undibacterium umbellatum TaxID=2762300 RepID=UPI003BB4E3C3